MFRLKLLASRSARKEGNIAVARRLMASYWHDKTNSTQMLDSEIDSVLSGLDPVLWVKQGAGLALKETAKLFYR